MKCYHLGNGLDFCDNFADYVLDVKFTRGVRFPAFHVCPEHLTDAVQEYRSHPRTEYVTIRTVGK